MARAACRRDWAPGVQTSGQKPFLWVRLGRALDFDTGIFGGRKWARKTQGCF